MMSLNKKPTKILLFIGISIGVNTSIGTYSIAKDVQAQREKMAQKSEVWKPVPAIVTTFDGKAPSDATVLFNGEDLSAWQTLKGGEADWYLTDGNFTVNPGSGDIKTKQRFCDIQLHMEWKTPTEVKGLKGQQRNNSGIFLQQRYEIQILDSFNNPTYANGQAASVYKQSIPLVNVMRPAGQWQYYDIIYTAPRFDGTTLTNPAFVTVIHNGVLVQNHVKIHGKTEWIGSPSYEVHGCAPLQLQDHGNQVSFRNLWVRHLNTQN
jgi:hypothetical protein